MAKLGSLVVELATNSAKFVQGINSTNRKLDQFAKNARRVANVAGGAFALIGVGNLGKELVDLVDKYKLMEGRLKLVQREGENLARTQEKLFDLSQRTRGDVEGTVNFYVQLARATKTLGLSQETLLSTTEAINKAIIISGASSQSANAALFQLQQGLAAGALRGQELNSVLEQTPRVAEAIANGLGVTIGQLRKLGEEGKLTAEAVIGAIQKQATTLDQEFSQVPVTVAQNMQLLTNEFEKAAKGAGGLNFIINKSIESLVNWTKAYNAAFNPSGKEKLRQLQDDYRILNNLIERGAFQGKRINEQKREELATIERELNILNERIIAEQKLEAIQARVSQNKKSTQSSADPKAQAAAYTEWFQQAEAFYATRIDFEKEQADKIAEENKTAYDEWLAQDMAFRNARLSQAEDEAAKQRRIEENKGRVILNSTASMFGSLASIVGNGSKKQFELSKKLARAETIISTYAAAQQAYAWTVKVAGPVAASAAAAAAIASGLARLTAINRTSFDSSSAAGASSGAGSFVPTPTPGPITPNQTNAAQGQTFIIITDGTISEAQMDDIMERAEQRINEGSQVIIRRDSVQAQELASAVS